MQNELLPRLVNDWTSSVAPSTQPEAEPSAHPVWSAPAQPPACRAEISLSPAGIRALGDLTDHLPAAGLFLVLLALTVVIVREGRVFTAKQAERADSFSVRHGSPVHAPAPFGSPAMAARALTHEETAYWQHLLAAFAGAIEPEGYTFGTDAREKVALPHATRALAGAAIVAARSRHITPQRSEGDLEDFLLQAAKDGYAGSWADWCQRGAEAAGWYVIRREVNPPADRGSTE
ncbi:TPA: hypothetical protein JD264_18700 [Serratia fonticola]|nr:hypothetical protein [Serratia fonticola]